MLKNYLVISFRNLIRNKGYSFINIFGFAIGMASCLLLLLYVQYELSFDGYHDKAGRIYRIADIGKINENTFRFAMTPAMWPPTMKEEFPEIENFVRIKPPMSRWMLRYENIRFYEKGFVFADSTVFDVFDFELERGNPKTALRDPFTLVMTEEMGRKYFGDDDPVGKVLLLDNLHQFTVTGILKEIPLNSHFTFDFLASYETLFRTPIYGGIEHMMNHTQYSYILLKNDADPGILESGFPEFIDTHLGQYIENFAGEFRIFLQPLESIHLHSNLDGEISPNSDIMYVYIYMSIAIIILLIAGINYINLATARSANRSREVGMRKVVGANRINLVSQFIGESVFISLISVIIATALVAAILPYFNTMTGNEIEFNLFRNQWIAAIIAGILLFSGFAVGSYPAIYLSAFQPVDVLKGKLSAGAKGSLLRKILVISQFSISIMLMISTIIVYNQLEFTQTKRLGFDKEHVVVLPLPDSIIRTRYETFKTALMRKPGIINAGAANSVPGELTQTAGVVPEGLRDDETILVSLNMASYDFLETMSVKFADGRNFSREFPTDTMNSIIINEAFVRRMGWENPIGKTVGFGPQFRPEVIGVVKNFHYKSLHSPIEPQIILPHRGDDILFVAVKIQGNMITQALESIEQAWNEVNSDYVYEYSFLETGYSLQYAGEQRLGTMFFNFSTLAILIACLGLFGIASFTSEQRTKEIGIRKSLGATPVSIILLLCKEFLMLVLIANFIAWPLAYLIMNRWLDIFVYRINTGITPFIFSFITALTIALLTVMYQSVKASLKNPVDSLKYE